MQLFCIQASSTTRPDLDRLTWMCVCHAYPKQESMVEIGKVRLLFTVPGGIVVNNNTATRPYGNWASRSASSSQAVVGGDPSAAGAEAGCMPDACGGRESSEPRRAANGDFRRNVDDAEECAWLRGGKGFGATQKEGTPGIGSADPVMSDGEAGDVGDPRGKIGRWLDTER